MACHLLVGHMSHHVWPAFRSQPSYLLQGWILRDRSVFLGAWLRRNVSVVSVEYHY